MLEKIHKCSRMGLLSLGFNHPISQPNSLDFTRIKQSSQKRERKSSNGLERYVLYGVGDLWSGGVRDYKNTQPPKASHYATFLHRTGKSSKDRNFCNTLGVKIDFALAFHKHKHHLCIHDHKHMMISLIEFIIALCDVLLL